MTVGVSPSQSTRTLSDLVAEEIRVLLARRRMSQADLARKLDVSGTWVSYRLNGKQPIDLHDLERIAEILEVTPASLLATSQKPRGPRLSPFGHNTRPPAAPNRARPEDRRPRLRRPAAA